MIKKALNAIFLICTIAANAQRQEFPKEINLVFDYMIKNDFPELFNNKPYQFRPVSWQIIDINDDGVKEVFLQTYPHYTQSPTITIFRITSNDSVSRVIEGLAPGHLIPLSKEGDYFTPHSTGTAIDMTIEADPAKLNKMAQASLKFEMSCIIYNSFMNSDKREGKVFLDLSYLKDYSVEKSCEKFQFSKPDFIIAGKVKGSSSKYFVAKADNELFCYEIKGFRDNTFIDKTIKIIRLPSDLVQLVVEEGYIKYTTKDGRISDLII